MPGWRIFPLLFAAVTVLATAIALSTVSSPPGASALPPAGIDALGATGQVTALSRLGQETIEVQGSVTIQRQDPHMDGSVEVADAEIIGLSLTGESVTGPITINESPVLASTGEIRSMQADQQFPASSFFDTFIDVVIPGSGHRTPASLHNVSALRLTAASAINEWPPTGVKYESAPLQNVDNDGDTLIDEDTADDDGDGLYDEDPPGGGNQDTDDEVDEDPPASQCPPATPGEVTLCDEDGDGLIDEDPSCLPLFPTMPAGVCVVAVSITLGELPITETPCPPEICGPSPTRTITPTRTPGPTQAPTATPESACEPAGVAGGVYSDTLEGPLVIPDDSAEGVSDCFAVDASKIISDVDVILGISHTWVGDLRVILTHEQTGTSVVLLDRPGHPSALFGCGSEDIDATLDDEASSSAEEECGSGTAALSGRLKPNDQLAAFDGENVSGDWTIRVMDPVFQDVGTLDGWALVVNAAPQTTHAGDANCNDVVDSIDAALILQFVAGLVRSLPCETRADANEDGDVNSIDSALVLQFVAGFLDELPP